MLFLPVARGGADVVVLDFLINDGDTDVRD